MTSTMDWTWKLREAIERIKTRYNHIGRKTGAPFLAIIYPPEAELAVLKEWRTLLATLDKSFDVRTIDVLSITMSVLDELGCENVVDSIARPMPGSNPESELGQMWVSAIVSRVRDDASRHAEGRIVIALEHMAALYPATGPRAIMQALWDCEGSILDGPVIALIPGTLVQSRVYSFVNRCEEFMYRGDIL